MGRIKSDLFTIDKNGDYHGIFWELEQSAIFRFINLNFENIAVSKKPFGKIFYENSLTYSESINFAKEINIIINLLNHDSLISHREYLLDTNIARLKDFNSDPELMMLYFSSIQIEFKMAFDYLLELHLCALENHSKLSMIEKGPFDYFGNHLYKLGSLEYEVNNGHLVLSWDNEVKSFEQLLLRSMVSFFQNGGISLKYIRKCENNHECVTSINKQFKNKNLKKLCTKYYFNTTGNDRFCSKECRKLFGSLTRSQVGRFKQRIGASPI